MRGKRSDKVGDLIKVEIAHMLLHELKDPRIGFVTVTGVAVSDDLRHAKVYYSVFGDEPARQESAAGLESAKGYMKRELGRRIRLKFVPEITFFRDDSLEYARTIDNVLQRIKDEAESS